MNDEEIRNEVTEIIRDSNIEVIEYELMNFPINKTVTLQTNNIKKFIKDIKKEDEETVKTVVYDENSKDFFYFTPDVTLILKTNKKIKSGKKDEM